MAREATLTERFERFELKFWAPVDRIEWALAQLDVGMQLDAFVAERGGTQLNTSLYFDSPRFTFFEQHVSGSPDRIKLRVRYYGERPSGDCFFEIKRRQNAMVTKRRAVLTLDEARPLVEDIGRPLPRPGDALSAFQYLALRCQAEPKLLVRARRQSLKARDPGVDVRVTVDRDIAWQPTRGTDALMPHDDLWRPLPAPPAPGHPADERALMEVKFLESRPWWLTPVLTQLGPWRVSFSKYVAAAFAARNDPFFTIDSLASDRLVPSADTHL